MSTRASIRFVDEYGDTIYVYRHSDGYPSGDILKDLRTVIDTSYNRWSGAAMGQVVARFFGLTFQPSDRLQDYEVTNGIHGDEDYHYFVKWDDETKKYIIGYDEQDED